MRRTKLSILKDTPIIWLFIISLPVFIYALILSTYSSEKTLTILFLASSAYFLLAILHHIRDRSLTLEVSLEYLLIVALALVIIHSYLIY